VENEPTAQALVVPTACPAAQKKPAGQGSCSALASRWGQKKPAAHGLEVFVALPSARQWPRAHAEHAAAPGPLKKPAAQERPAAVMAVLATVCGALML
jgi:hypothetical protein